eukprot:TRINITY_DN6570_c0_g2_i2.p1 TRINITY_DN6570_c0_g2~~TRINITY_DN6570_c0_g2_i2.p1  ORF type:complete len:1309 (+),score=180.83 TRINITY_DN6570_c0_g2_i2:8156-12082(+)
MSYCDSDGGPELEEYDAESTRADCYEPKSPSPLETPVESVQDLKDPYARDWNGEFQSLLAEATLFEDSESDKLTLSEKELARTLRLRHLSNSFAEEATRIAVQIIQELFLPVGNRRYKSVTHVVGGVAGGEKFVSSGIFFKLSRDWKGIYGSDCHAIKAAELELKGTMALLDCRVNGLHFPLMALIRYRGFAVVAQSILPINRSTLRYGSRDAGNTIKNEDPVLAAKFAAAAGLLNLKAHNVWNKDGTQCVLLHGPADIEVHKGSDGRCYVVDTARLFPPTAPDGKIRSQLYCTLRPELVKLNSCALSSDAFSRFGGSENNIHDAEVISATQRLTQAIIPTFASYLDKRFNEEYDSSSDKHPSSYADFLTATELTSLGAEMHLHGINYRYLLHVWHRLRGRAGRTFCLIEACARTAKHLLEEKWRCLEAASESRYLREASEFFGLLADCDDESRAYWLETIAEEVLLRFSIPQGAKSPFSDVVNVSSLIPVPLLLFRTSQLVGVEFDTHYMKRVLVDAGLGLGVESEASTEEQVYKLLEALVAHKLLKSSSKHIVCSIKPRTKYLHRVSFEEGTALCRVALARQGPEAKRLFKQANDRFAECLTTKPNDYRALYNWAFALCQQASAASSDEARILWKEMADKFSRALILQPKDWRALAKWGTALQMQSRTLDGAAAIPILEESSSKLNQAVSLISFPHFKTLFNAGNADLNLARALDHATSSEHTQVERALTRSLQHLNKAILLDPSSVDALRNGAVAAAMLARLSSEHVKKEALYDKAFTLYQRALELNPKNPEVLYSFGNACFRRATSQRERGDDRASSTLLHACLMYAAALECVPSFKDSFVNLSVGISLAVKWRLSLTSRDSPWIQPIRKFLRSTEAFTGQLSARELSSVAAACKGLTSDEPCDISAAAACTMDKLQIMMKESSASQLPHNKSSNRKRSTSVGQTSSLSSTEAAAADSKHRGLASSGVMPKTVPAPALSNNRHGETDPVSVFSILPTPRDAQMLPGPADSESEPSPVTFIDVLWGSNIVYAFDHDAEISESRLKIVNTILGRCRTGLVFLAEYRGTRYALKVRPRNPSVSSPRRIPIFRGPAYAPLKFLLQSDGKLCCLFDRIFGVPLETYIVEHPQTFTPTILKFYFAEICAACAPVVGAGLELLDFKSSSVIMSDSGHCRLLVSFFDVAEGLHPQSVWYSVGLLFMDLLNKSRVLETSVTQEAASLVSLAQQLTHEDPSKRLQVFRKIKRHPAFDNVKWRYVGSQAPPLTYDGVEGGVEISDHAIAATLIAPEAPNQLDGFTIVNTPGTQRS